MSKENKNISRIAKDIISNGPSNESIIDSILNEQSKFNKDIILRMSTNNISYEAFKGEKDNLIVVKEINPNCKIAGKDFNKSMSKKRALKEIISSVISNFFKNEKECRKFIEEL